MHCIEADGSDAKDGQQEKAESGDDVDVDEDEMKIAEEEIRMFKMMIDFMS